MPQFKQFYYQFKNNPLQTLEVSDPRRSLRWSYQSTKVEDGQKYLMKWPPSSAELSFVLKAR